MSRRGLADELARRTRELEQSEARFRDVIERNADAIVVVDEEGIVQFANAMAVRLFGRGRSELIGSPFGFPLVSGETTELDLAGGNGPVVVEMRVVDSAWEGRPARLATLRDVTERRQAEEAARGLYREQAARAAAEQAARRFRFLAESSTVLASSLDYSTTLKALARLCVENLCDWVVIYLVECDDAIRRFQVVHRDRTKTQAAQALREHGEFTDVQAVRDVLATGRTVLVRGIDDTRLATLILDAEQRSIVSELGIASLLLTPVTVRDRALGAIALISAEPARQYDEQDIELIEDLARRVALAIDNALLYRAAQEAAQKRSDYLAVVSHDLRTPLNSIMGHAELLTLGIPDALSDGCLEHVERIRTGARHLQNLIDELLTLVRLDAGREELQLVTVHAFDVVHDVASVIELLAHERGLDFHVDVAASVELVTDGARLRQVLMNLVTNAVKYTERGVIRLEVVAEDDEIAFHVRDTGIGIEPEHLEHIFEPFWQADRSRRGNGGGVGLGLSVVQRIVQLIGGTVQVESVPGSGSTFTVRLPLRQPVPAQPPSAATTGLSSTR